MIAPLYLQLSPILHGEDLHSIFCDSANIGVNINCNNQGGVNISDPDVDKCAVQCWKKECTCIEKKSSCVAISFQQMAQYPHPCQIAVLTLNNTTTIHQFSISGTENEENPV